MESIKLIFLVSTILMVFPSVCLAAFSFDVIKEQRKELCVCDCSNNLHCNTLDLIWNYVTTDSVTVIEWYKQPGIIIARIFGVNIGAPFTVLPPYNAIPYTVTRLETSKYNAAIRIQKSENFSETDEAVYSVNVTAASPQSEICPQVLAGAPPPPSVSCNPNTCNIPTNATIDVRGEETESGDKYRCTLKGGNAECSCEPLFDECTITISDCYYCLLALILLFLLVVLVEIVILVVIIGTGKDEVSAIQFIYHLVLCLPLFGWLTFIRQFSEKGLHNKNELKFSVKEKIWINAVTTLGVLVIIILQFALESDECKFETKPIVCFVLAAIFAIIAIMVLVLRYTVGCEKCGKLRCGPLTCDCGSEENGTSGGIADSKETEEFTNEGNKGKDPKNATGLKKDNRVGHNSANMDTVISKEAETRIVFEPPVHGPPSDLKKNTAIPPLKTTSSDDMDSGDGKSMDSSRTPASISNVKIESNDSNTDTSNL